ncbi:hypothetical protein J31TS4_45110 [Paenibacillus sp. J31TS4]|uniref:serine hydrolase domain-containing protein n=1 Tax=Paenibacillus sp. J31TS4 TaxID=2807195 RepID=UPI001B19302A|nr:serine hydrolase [Paenibacillus sp. J31TS4]GIP41231.1 hypothetical protein J31TS4_45110 [Paenibacillus sp. J31TS4]
MIPAARYYPPPESEGGWRTLARKEDARALGLDPDELAAFADWNLSIGNEPGEPPSPVGFLAIKDGWLVHEAYDRPETRDRLLWIASIGKSITSCLFGRWLEEGRRGKLPFRLELDDLVYDPRYLPEGFPLSDERKTAITFRHVLTHTSGLPASRFVGGEGFSFVEYTLGRSAAYPDTVRLLDAPGAGYAYSNVGYNHFSILAPHVSGRMYRDSVERELFRPLGIGRTDWFGEGPSYTYLSRLYEPSNAGPDMTARDLARYAYLLLSGGEWEGRVLVPASYLEEAKQVHRINGRQPADYGLGMRTNAEGGISAFWSRLMFALVGKGLNVALLVPELDLLLVRTSQVQSEGRPPFLPEFARRAERLLL